MYALFGYDVKTKRLKNHSVYALKSKTTSRPKQRDVAIMRKCIENVFINK